MKSTDKSSNVLKRLGIILDASKSAADKLSQYLVNTNIRPDIYKELFLMLNSVDDLLELVVPTKTAGELHGLPREATVMDDEHIQFFHVERPEWDFTAWFGEKVTNVKFAVKGLIKYYEMDPASLSLRTNEVTPSGYIKEGIDANLHYVKSYSQVVYDQVFDDKLEIRIVTHP